MIRHDWTKEEIKKLYHTPLLDLIAQARTVHVKYHPPDAVQLCTLLSIKTGGCPEDCHYCSQSAHYKTEVKTEPLLALEEVREKAQTAKQAGSTRFCMGAAWRQIKDGPEFDKVLEMVKTVAATGMEVCCTLGMLTESQAMRLKQAGLTAYNHNLDTSPEYYVEIITTRTYEDRLNTLRAVRKAGITVCCGGIIGMGENEEGRIGLLHQLSILDPHPESVPINALVAVDGTPLQGIAPLDAFDFCRTIAAARILMPQSMVRLSAGRLSLSKEAQALCFLAGANSLFTGEKLLTTPNPDYDEDKHLLAQLGLRGMEPKPATSVK